MNRQTNTESKQPVHTIRHRSIKATIWRNPTDTGPMYKVLITRSYRENEQWHDTSSLGYDDLLIAAKLLNDAHTAITALRAKDGSSRSDSQPVQPAASRNRPNPKPRKANHEQLD